MVVKIILYIKWNFVRGSFVVVVVVVFYVPTVLQYSTLLLYMCSKQKHMEDHGHKKGHTPQAL